MATRPDLPSAVIVIGGGNAALCAALTARSLGAEVVLLERAPRELRGGNTRHTRNIRHVHAGPDPFVTGRYEADELWDDLVLVSGPDINEGLARLTVERSRSCPTFMEEHGIRWQPSLRGTLHLTRTNRFFLGGGKALINTYYSKAAAIGIEVRYETKVVGLEFQGPQCVAVIAERAGSTERIPAQAVVVASGGFEANVGWLEQYWGEAANNFIIRGSETNDGVVLQALLEGGAKAVGDPRGFHAVAVDARAPQFDGGIVTRIDSVPFGVVVNASGERFADEGQDLWPRRYASWGRLIAEQPGQSAFSIFDARSRGRFIPGMYPAHASDTVAGLAQSMGLDAAAVERTVRVYNDSVHSDGAADFSQLDGRTTVGLTPPKSNWAERIDHPPFYGYPLRPGITFTYRGVEVNDDARVICESGQTFANVFAAGEIMAGNVLTKGYLAGIGLTIGTVFGQIAGASAARQVAG